jgi:Cytochrome c/c1 heme lyase
MFFNAMRRKNFDPKETDMRTIVPIHNAVNEKAWKEIKGWESGRGGERYVDFSVACFRKTNITKERLICETPSVAVAPVSHPSPVSLHH